MECNQNLDINEEVKLDKIKYPKRKYVLIHGYNGHQYHGNQKNKEVKTIEEEMEREIYKIGLISECNYGTLQKIGWSRASRTDKKVSAVMNVVSVKLHKIPDFDENKIKFELNNNLPNDIKIFRIIEVSPSFDAKDNNNNREYHYILPSFCLEPKSLSKQITNEKNIDNYTGDYSFKITPEYHDKIKTICKFFKGTKIYHNYTKKLNYSEPSAKRHIYELSCDEIIKFDNFEALKFKIIGQSFLYNQIRKMIGAIIEICHDSKDASFLENSVMANKMDIAKAPAEGLYLYKIDYSRYNDRKFLKKNNIELSEIEDKEMENFRSELVRNIETIEVKEKVFSKWLYKYDTHKENIY